MIWPLITVMGTLLAASVNFTDKYLIDKILKGSDIGSLVLFSSFLGLPLSIVIYLFNPSVINADFNNRVLLILTGIIYVSATIPYFYALGKDDTSTVVPLLQMSSIFTLVLSYLFLRESLNVLQILGCTTILLGALGLTLEFSTTKDKGLKIKKSVFGLMFVSSILLALNAVIFKKSALDTDLSTALFWTYLGFFIFFAFVITFHSNYRNNFISVLKRNKSKILALNLFNELQSIGSITLFSIASLMAPLALVSFFSEGFKPLVVLLSGYLLTKVFPSVIKENIDRDILLQKIISIFLITVGSYLILN